MRVRRHSWGPLSTLMLPLLSDGRRRVWWVVRLRLGPLTIALDWRGSEVARHWIARRSEHQDAN